jgi:hypothetical protein
MHAEAYEELESRDEDEELWDQLEIFFFWTSATMDGTSLYLLTISLWYIVYKTCECSSQEGMAC